MHEWARRRFGAAPVEEVSRAALTAGISSASVQRIDVDLVFADGHRVPFSLVRKAGSATEIAALAAAAQVRDAPALPELLDYGDGPDGPWVLMPFYEGTPPASDLEMPEGVIDTLARLHAHYLGASPIAEVPSFGRQWWRAKCAIAAERLRAVPGPAARAALDVVTPLANAQRILTALDELPTTLLHGDVHRNNVVAGPDGGAHLLDWADARQGPPTFDLVNVMTLGDDAWRTYAASWAAATGIRLEADEWRHSFRVATVCINTKYIAFAARQFGDETAARMTGKILDALADLRAGG